MRIVQSVVLSVALVSLVTACSKSQETQIAPKSNSETGVIIQGSEADVNAVLSQSSEYRVLSATHGLYEVKGLNLSEVKALAPQLSAEKNQYFDKLVSSERKNPNLESLYKKWAQDEDLEEGGETNKPVVTQKLPPALEGCDMSRTQKPTVEIGLTSEVLSQSLTMNFGETVGFTGINSKPHVSNPDSKLEFRWDVMAPGLSSIPAARRDGDNFELTPDSVGMYQVVLVAKDDQNSCEFFIGRFMVTHNPEIEFAKDEEPRPSIELKHFTHLAKVEAEKSWETATGKGVTVAVLDTGLQYNHPAIKFNLALNNSEMSGASGVDEDTNDFVDDVVGWDFVNGDNKPFDDEGHGSHVSGLTSSHIIGTAKDSKLLPVKVLNAAGGGDVASIIAGIYYAVDNGAQVINASLGAPIPQFKTMIDAIKYAHSKNVVFVAAAGNESLDLSQPGTDVWPAELDVPNIITVAATGANDDLTSYSNLGKLEVDVAAPGGDGVEPIFSLATLNTHEAEFVGSGGTSMAAPIVAGIVAQVLEVNPSLTPEDVKELLMQSGKDVEALVEKVGSGKLLQSSEAVSLASQSLL